MWIHRLCQSLTVSPLLMLAVLGSTSTTIKNIRDTKIRLIVLTRTRLRLKRREILSLWMRSPPCKSSTRVDARRRCSWVNLDGSLNGAFLDFLTDLAVIKFPATVNTRSYMVRRSLAITRWIRNIQVAFLRSVSDNIARSAALYSSQSREVVESILTNMPNTGINP